MKRATTTIVGDDDQVAIQVPPLPSSRIHSHATSSLSLTPPTPSPPSSASSPSSSLPSSSSSSTAASSPLSLLPAELYLFTWIFLSVGLTLLNKAVFSFGSFRFPLFISAVHMLLTWILSYVCVHYLHWFPYNDRIDSKARTRLFLYSFLFSINIVFGNLSIKYASVSLVQVFRAIVPGITMLLSYFILGKRYTLMAVSSLIPICAGVMLTVTGEIDLTWLGLFYTVVGLLLSCLKVVLCNKFLDGYDLNPLDLLARLSPYAFLQTMVLVYFSGEWDGLMEKWDTMFELGVFVSIVGSGVLAWLMNVTNFFTNQKTSPITLTVGGNVKQILTIIISIIIFKNVVTGTGALGIAVTIFGAGIYSYVSYNKL
jgi:drug/metabolite transporter (DMT)-like permease